MAGYINYHHKHLFFPDDDFYEEDDDEDDPDALKDPIYQIDLQVTCSVCIYIIQWSKINVNAAFFFQAYLTDFLTQFAQQPCYSMFSSHLNDCERKVLQSVGI